MDLLLTHDSGLLHVAEGAGCPTVAVFGPTNPGVVSRRGARTTCLWRPGGSEACHDEASGEVRCRYAPCCIQRVPVADVVLAGGALLGGAPEGPPAFR
jgi:ADP-heptose:LPS heptosyltransferase